MREKTSIEIGGRRYTIEAMGSLEACALLPIVAETVAPAVTALMAMFSGDVKGSAAELASALQGSKHYPALVRAMVPTVMVQVPLSEGGDYGPAVKLADQMNAGSSFFSRRQFELLKLTLEFVKWNYSDFFADILPMLGQAIRATAIQGNDPPRESTGTSSESSSPSTTATAG